MFLELIKVERLEGDAPPEGFWFTDILKRGLLGNKARLGTAQERAEKQAWLKQWGYSEARITSPFEAKQPGLLTWPDEHAEGKSTGRSTGNFISRAQTHANGILIPVESLYAATTFGLLALELLTTTGMRIMWNMLSVSSTINAIVAAFAFYTHESLKVEYHF